MKPSRVNVIRVFRSATDPRRGRLQAGNLVLPCALGRSGTSRAKREGDGASPVGRFRILQAFYRADRGQRPRTGLRLRPIRPGDGWSDDVRDRRYNHLVPLPCPTSHERMWRDDHLYDLVVILGHNDDPPVPGLGSAIFLHLAKPDYAPTHGCVALARADLEALLTKARPGDTLEIRG